MNTQRYIACGVVSVALHSLAISAQTPAPQFAINDANSGQTVAIQFVARAAEPEKAPEPSVEPEETLAPEPSPVEVKKETADVAPVVPPKPRVDKPEKKRPEKKKRQEKAKPPLEKPKPVVEKVTKPDPEKETEKKPKQHPEKDAKPAEDSQPISASASSPVLVDKPAFKVRPSPPNYPRKARRRGMEGTVLLEVWLDEDGNQTQQNILQSSGHELLDDAALKAVRKWQFNQHTINGVALAHRVRIPVRFNLD